MTAAQAGTRTTSEAGGPDRPQWVSMSRFFLGHALSTMLWTTGVTLAIAVIGASLGWQVEVIVDSDSSIIGLKSGGDDALNLWLLLVVASVAIAAVVHQIVLTCLTRVLVAAGATRRSVAVGLGVTAVFHVLYVTAVTVAVLLVIGRNVDGARSLLSADSAADLAVLTAQAAGSVAVGLVAAMAVTALFLRWPWWVGAIGLTLAFAVLPALTRLLWPEVGSLLAQPTAWWGSQLLLTLVCAGAFWWLLRRVPATR